MSEPTALAVLKIPANPDIAGIGVRTSIYIQNLLCLLSALWALWDGKVTQGKLEYAEMQSTTNLILAFAILISSMAQASTLGITNYHANIVLMTSWMNNTNAFVYFILYVHHKVGLPEAEGGVGTTWGAWVNHVRQKFSLTLSSIKGHDAEATTDTNNGATTDRTGARILVKRYVLMLGSLHLTLMATLGVWLWSDPQLFGLGNRTPLDFKVANALAMERARVAVFGQGVPFGSLTLRAASIAIYSIFLIPGINLIAPMIFFLAAYFGCRRIPSAKRWDVLPAYIGLGILLVINLIFIADIELTFKINTILQGSDESDWGFGQILAILLLLLPLRDLVEAILARRLKQRQGELDEDLREAIEREEFDRVKRAIERGCSFPSPKSPDQHYKFWNLISTHGELDYFDNLRRTRMTIAEKALEEDLHSAIREKNESRINAAYKQRADLLAGVLQLPMDATGMVFWYASKRGHGQLVSFHARRPGPHVNGQGPGGRTALMRAAEDGDVVLCRALLDSPLININLRDAHGRTALLAAAECGRQAIVEMLLERNDIQANAADEDGLTPLIRASREGHKEIVTRLLERDDTQPNAADEGGFTALIEASHWGHQAIVNLLLERKDVKPNVADKDGRTPMIWASQMGHQAIVTRLLEQDNAQLNAADKDGRTPLIWASRCGREGLVRMLLSRADIQLHKTDRLGRTAYDSALSQKHDNIARLILAHSSSTKA